MTARLARTLSSLAVAALTAACASYSEIPIETPIRPTMDVSAFQRVLVAGFISGGTEDVDGNLETTRLLRSQLRNKSGLRVIDSDSLPLMDVASEGRSAGNGAAPAAPAAPKDEKEMDLYANVFANVEYLEEDRGGIPAAADRHRHGALHAASAQQHRSARGRGLRLVRTPARGAGPHLHGAQGVRAQSPKFIFIDGRTGTVMHSQSAREEILYNANQATPALSSYFELMDRVLPSFLSALSSQKVKGTRVLLQ